MDMTRATIFERNLSDKLWSEIVLAMTYVKNVYPIKVLNEKNPYNIQQKDQLDIHNLRILESIIYILIHKEKQALKSK